MAARTKSRVTPKYKTKYRVTNWPAYEKSLRRRGDVTVWFDEDAVEAWNAPARGLSGGQLKYSDVAIVTALTLRTVFHLPLRQTEGFLASLIRLVGLSLETPDHTTLSRRSRTVEVPRLTKARSGAIHLVIDSTGLKIVGGGEWHAHKHGLSNKRLRRFSGLGRWLPTPRPVALPELLWLPDVSPLVGHRLERRGLCGRGRPLGNGPILNVAGDLGDLLSGGRVGRTAL
jgi:hypothetical protein